MPRPASPASFLACALAACGASKDAPPPDSCSSLPTGAVSTAAATYPAHPHYCLFTFAQNVTGARGLAFAPNGDLFVAGGGQLVVLFDTNGDGVSGANE